MPILPRAPGGSSGQPGSRGAAGERGPRGLPGLSAIGGQVSAGTPGSVLFIGASGLLAQDNANLFWDATNQRLGVGTNNPGQGYTVAPDIVAHIYRTTAHSFLAIDTIGTSKDAGIILYTATANNDAAIFLDESDAQKLKIATGTLSDHTTRQSSTRVTIDQSGQVGIGTTSPGAPLQVNGTIRSTPLTTGSVLFAAANGAISQDNANLFWDATNKYFAIGTTGPNYPLHVAISRPAASMVRVQNTSSTGFCTTDYYDSSGTLQVAIGMGNASVVGLGSNLNYIYSPAKDFNFLSSTKTSFLFGMTDNSTSLQFANGSSASASASSTGKIIYTTTGQKFQVSANAGSYFDVALMAAALTTGSIPFADSSGHLAQDNANLFWDATNKHLGIGTASPASTMSVTIQVPNTTNAEGMKIIAGGTTSYADLNFFSTTSTQKGGIGYAGSGTGTTMSDLMFFYTPSVDWVMSDTVTNFFRWYTTTNSVGFEMANGGSAGASGSNKGKLIYTTTGQKFQVSANAAGYLDVVLASSGGTANTTAVFTAANKIANGWALDDGTTWGVSGKFTITEASGNTVVGGSLKVAGNLGVFNTTPVTQATVTGSRGGNAALASLLTALAGYGLIVDSTTA